MKLTFDTNCLIDLENSGVSAPALRAMIGAHRSGQVTVRVVGISASERQRGGRFAENFAEFQEKLDHLGLSDLEILKPKAYFGVTYWGWCIYDPKDPNDPEEAIHRALFPNLPFRYTDYCAGLGLDPHAANEIATGKWRNARCDVLALWSHIYYDGDVFITSDQNFHKATKKPRLLVLGAGAILTPLAATARLRRLTSIGARSQSTNPTSAQ